MSWGLQGIPQSSTLDFIGLGPGGHFIYELVRHALKCPFRVFWIRWGGVFIDSVVLVMGCWWVYLVFLGGGLRFRQPHLRPITRNIWHGRRNNEVQVLVVPLNAHGTLNKPPHPLLQWPHKSLSSATHGHKLKLAYNCLFNCFRAVGGFDGEKGFP